jgi:hypothetical protein
MARSAPNDNTFDRAFQQIEPNCSSQICFGSASIEKSELERCGVGGLVLSFDFSLVPGLGEFLVTVGKDGLFFAEKFVLRGDVSDGGV